MASQGNDSSAQGAKELAEQVLVALLVGAATQIVLVAADYARKKYRIWRCPKCDKLDDSN